MSYWGSSVGVARRARVAVSPIAGGLAVVTPYDKAFTEALKVAVPGTDRQWDVAGKRWIVAPQHGRIVVDLIDTFYGVEVALPSMLTLPVDDETRMLQVRYVGRCKLRDDGSSSAYAYVDGGWTVIFPETVLRTWFEGIPPDVAGGVDTSLRPTLANTLYATLGVRQGIADDDLRSAYRRLARQWHPDVCREADAAAQFKAIQRAYETLRDPERRQRYDAGLALEAMVGRSLATPQPRPPLASPPGDYRSPLRCGWVLCDGAPQLARFVVNAIHGWEDIVNEYGQTLVVSWPAGADSAIEEWV